MSFSFDGLTGVEVTGLSITSAIPQPRCLGLWAKLPATTGTRFRGLGLTNGANGDIPAFTLQTDTNASVEFFAQDVNQSSQVIVIGAINVNVWTLLLGVFDDVGDLVVAYKGNVATASVARTSAMNYVFNRIRLGVLWSASNFFTPSGTLLALPWIANRVPTSLERDSLVAGAHPQAVFGADLVDVWPLNSKTSLINGWTFVDVGTGAVTINTADNPVVNAPPSGGAVAFEGSAVAGATVAADLSVSAPAGSVALQGAAAGGATVSGALSLQKTFRATLVDPLTGAPRASWAGLSWRWWASLADMATSAAAASGSGASTDAAGVLTLPSSAPLGLLVGADQGVAVITDLGTVTDASARWACCRFDVI